MGCFSVTAARVTYKAPGSSLVQLGLCHCDKHHGKRPGEKRVYVSLSGVVCHHGKPGQELEAGTEPETSEEWLLAPHGLLSSFPQTTQAHLSRDGTPTVS